MLDVSSPALAQDLTAPPAPVPNAAPASSLATKPPPAGAKLPRADEFTTVAGATAHCPGDSVVWSSLSKSKAFHVAASKYYGKTKHGAYVCEKDALSAGYHAAKT